MVLEKIDQRTFGSASEMQAYAAQFAKQLEPGEHLGLVGSLGAGKTTFVQGLAAGLGAEGEADSPTFTLRQSLTCSGHRSIKELIHVDLYRLVDEVSVAELGLSDDFVQSGSLVVIEWIDRVPSLWKHMTYHLTFSWDQKTEYHSVLVEKESRI